MLIGAGFWATYTQSFTTASASVVHIYPATVCCDKCGAQHPFGWDHHCGDAVAAKAIGERVA